MARVNDLLALDLPQGRFVTVAMRILDPRSHMLRLYSAGHGPQLFFTAHSAIVDGFHADDLPLGVKVPMEVGIARELRCEPGDSLVLTTDGFFEWANPDSEIYGTARLRDFLAAHHQMDPSEFIKTLHANVVAFSRGTKQADDLTAVVIKRCTA